jgi:hypothetical protein
MSGKDVEKQNLVKVTLVPVEVFGTDCPKCNDGIEHYGLCDAVPAYSDCNRADGQIYRRDDESSVPYRNPDDVITIYVPRNELSKFDKKFGDDYE